MAIRYSIHTYRVKNPKDGQMVSSKWVSVKTKKNYRISDLVREMAGDSPAKKGELTSAFMRIAACIERVLSAGNSVTIDGYGTFQVTARIREGKEDENFRAESVELKNIVFTATRDAKKRINSAGFERYHEEK